jgi:ribosomal protein L13E
VIELERQSRLPFLTCHISVLQTKSAGKGRRVPDRSCSPIVARLARHLGLLIEYRRWTHCGVESIANLRKRLADYTQSAHRLLA